MNSVLSGVLTLSQCSNRGICKCIKITVTTTSSVVKTLIFFFLIDFF